MDFLIVFLGAGVGGALRHGVNLTAASILSIDFPFGTLAVNVVGSFAVAMIVEYFAFKSGLPQQARLFLTTGILGGFTTFSAFSLDTVALFERGQVWISTAYVLGTVAVSLVAFVLGLTFGRTLFAGSL